MNIQHYLPKSLHVYPKLPKHESKTALLSSTLLDKNRLKPHSPRSTCPRTDLLAEIKDTLGGSNPLTPTRSGDSFDCHRFLFGTLKSLSENPVLVLH